MMSKTSKYQKKIEETLKENLQDINNVEVKHEHRSNIEVKNGVYSPRMDIVIFPEAESSGTNIYHDCKVLKSSGRTKDFIDRIIKKTMFKKAKEDWYCYNTNPRYFIGIEIENGTVNNFKHILGSMTNLSSLCFMGVVVLCTLDSAINKKLEDYMNFVYEKKKIQIPLFPNVFILKRDDFEEIVSESKINWNFRCYLYS